MMRLVALGLVSLLFGGGCGTTEPVECLHPCVSTALVTVRVIDQAGEPIPSLMVWVRGYPEVCGERTVAGEGPQATRQNGERQLRIYAPLLPYSPFAVRCLRVFVSETTEAEPILADEYFPVELELRFYNRVTPQDSVRVEITVPQ